jgi:hypothetical protein
MFEAGDSPLIVVADGNASHEQHFDEVAEEEKPLAKAPRTILNGGSAHPAPMMDLSLFYRGDLKVQVFIYKVCHRLYYQY